MSIHCTCIYNTCDYLKIPEDVVMIKQNFKIIKTIYIQFFKQSSWNVSVLSDMTSKIWADFAKYWHKIGILQ